MRDTSSHYADMLNEVGRQIKLEIGYLMGQIGGKVCVAYYHTECEIDRNVFFDTDFNGGGIAYYLDTIYTDEKGNLQFELSDDEDAYHDTWELGYFSNTELLYILSELEDVINYAEENNEPIRTEYPDWATEE